MHPMSCYFAVQLLARYDPRCPICPGPRQRSLALHAVIRTRFKLISKFLCRVYSLHAVPVLDADVRICRKRKKRYKYESRARAAMCGQSIGRLQRCTCALLTVFLIVMHKDIQFLYVQISSRVHCRYCGISSGGSIRVQATVHAHSFEWLAIHVLPYTRL